MKTALITGPSAGIGRVTAIELGARGFHIVAAGRSKDRTIPVIAAIHRAGGTAEFLQIDLGSLTSVRSAAEEFQDRALPLDVLVNNAGVFGARGLTVDGFEPHFGINHLGHFQLTRALASTLVAGSRVITVTSALHNRVDHIDFDALTGPRRSRSALDEYAVSKLANILFSFELARRQPSWRTYAVHPGLTRTAIIPIWMRPFLRSRLISPEAGAATTIWCAVEPGLEAETGGYYARLARAEPSRTARDRGLAARLWEISQQWCDSSRRDVSP